MDTTGAALAASLLSLVAFAVVGVMFWRGSWLVLLAGRAASKEADTEALRALGRRMGVVLAVGGVLMLTLAAFLGAELAQNASVAWVATMANNVAFIAFIVAVVWFFLVQRPERDGKVDKAADSPAAARARSARLDHLHMPTILFVIVLLLIVGAVGVLAAL